MSEALTIYDCQEIISQIETKAELNDGELNDEDLQSLVEAQTQSIEKLGKLVGYVRWLEGFADTAKQEIQRIQARKKTAENRIAGIKRFLIPYIQQNGPKTVGTNRISLRKSKGVVLADGFNNPVYCEEVITYKPDKKAIKESIEDGIEVKGAALEERQNIQIR